MSPTHLPDGEALWGQLLADLARARRKRKLSPTNRHDAQRRHRHLGLTFEALEDRRLLAVTLTWTGVGKPLTLTGNTSVAPLTVLTAEPAPNISLLKIDLGAGNYFASGSTASATGLIYENVNSPTTSRFATIDISLANNVSALQATLSSDKVVLGPIRNSRGGIGSITVSAAAIEVKGTNTFSANGNLDLQAAGDLTIDNGAALQAGTGTISLAAGSAGTLTIGPGATVASSNSTVSAITLRGGDINIDASANPAVVGAQRIIDNTASVTTLTGVSAPNALAFDGSGSLFVANYDSNTVSQFAQGSTTPSATLTGLNAPNAMVFDTRGNLYVANSGANTVSVFEPGSTTPDATLTGLSSPQSLAFDFSGNLYVSNSNSNTVSKFTPGSTTPSTTITGLSIPGSLAFDGSGNLYVANWGGGTVSKFAAGSTTLSATLTGLSFPQSLVFDSSGNLYVANSNSNTVSKFASGATTASATLAGVNAPQALAIDGGGNLYAANAGTNGVAKFAAGATTPSLTLTGLSSPRSVVCDGSGNLFVANVGNNTVSKLVPTAITPTAAGVVIRSSAAARPMSLGGLNTAVTGINLTDEELARILTTASGTVTVGDSTQTGNITFKTAKVANTAGATTLVVQLPTGSGSVILDDSGSGIGLNGNGGQVYLMPGTGGVVVPIPSISTTGVALASNEFVAAGLRLTPTLSLPPTPGAQFTVISNTVPDTPWTNYPVSGVFTNLLNGGTIAVNLGATSYYFQANYAGGDGNDLVLTTLPATTTFLSGVPNPSTRGESVAFTLTTTGLPVSAGTVDFSVDNTVLASVPIDATGQATFTTSVLTVGTHTITAAYSGTGIYVASSHSVTQVVIPPPADSTTALIVDHPSPVKYGNQVVFTALVRSNGVPISTGTVDFKDGETVRASRPVVNGQAEWTTSNLVVSPHKITAVYNGTLAYAHSEAAIDLMVNPSDDSETPGLFDPITSKFHLYNPNNPTAPDVSFVLTQAGADWTPFTGDWNGDGAAGVGLYDPQTSTFYLANQPSSAAEFTFGFGVPGAGWIPLVGDWNGDGKMGVGLYDPIASMFYLTNKLSTGAAQYTFGYGVPAAGWIPLVGDWNGNQWPFDNSTGVGLYDPHTSTFYLTNVLSTGSAEYTFGYGVPNAGWKPLVGDWNGDKIAGVGLFDPSGSVFYLRDTLSQGNAEYTFGYGVPAGIWKPLVGDWNGDGVAGVGLFDPSGSVFYLRNTLSPGIAEITTPLGEPDHDSRPLNGCWPEGLLLQAESVVPTGSVATSIEANGLKPIVQEAIARWVAAGIDRQSLDAMQQANFIVTSLPGAEVGLTVGKTVYLDDNAAGHSWFVDPTPGQDEEFARLGADRQLQAVDPRAVDRLDLLTVVEHELGHIAGLNDLASANSSLMSATLPTGVRRLLSPS